MNAEYEEINRKYRFNFIYEPCDRCHHTLEILVKTCRVCETVANKNDIYTGDKIFCSKCERLERGEYVSDSSSEENSSESEEENNSEISEESEKSNSEESNLESGEEIELKDLKNNPEYKFLQERFKELQMDSESESD